MRQVDEARVNAFCELVAKGELPEREHTIGIKDTGLSPQAVRDMFHSQLLSRLLDLKARQMQQQGQGFYTIGSAGHEGNVVLGQLLGLQDMLFLHYRSGALFMQRSKLLPGSTPLYDMLLAFAASAEDPIAGGRHKVFGSLPLNIPPQTSTIASHLPKAVGTAYSIPLHKQLNSQGVLAGDAVVMCSFGDASLNHSTAQGALNTAAWIHYRHLPLPLLLVCEDNGLGISVKTPTDWVAMSCKQRPGIKYFYADGLDMLAVYQASVKAIDYVRRYRRPALLHLRMVRLYGHAGSDAQTSYLSSQEIQRQEQQDPLLYSARLLLDLNIMSAQDIIAGCQQQWEQVSRVAGEVVKRPKLTTRQQVMSTITACVQQKPLPDLPSTAARKLLFGNEWRQLSQPQPLNKLLNFALADLLLQYPQIVICGEDVGKKGGVYGVTSRLQHKFGPARVMDALLDEQSILGLATGLAHNGFLPVAEIQFLAYLHNAEDQLRGEAATLAFFSQGQFTNPMVIRIAGLAYQRGFGGHFHNDNSLAVLRDIPGLVIACPANGADAVAMLRSAVAYAWQQQRVVVFIEPIALYTTKDLHQVGDNLWAQVYPEIGQTIEVGEIGVDGNEAPIAIITYGNGVRLSQQAIRILEQQDGLPIKLIDLRWLAPIHVEALVKEIQHCSHILIVDECRQTGSVSEQLVTLLVEHLKPLPVVERITAADSFIPLGAAANLVLPQCDEIVQRVRQMWHTYSGTNENAPSTHSELTAGGVA
ncbi:thiamine pyrophosphate-dependent enzyme [Zooshikella ganghwensis]|uniref:3-methyl-2-oxobutanoate dehydrogenase (2-methylpropanoyl-transferring) n=1 Tax=Zooshikella ganghwensis TaxID=202772 RepID=A0A4P9VN73_9GAMM|nr:thiamine pyrophosphate-dependent enzyme [Zooshikella ganghwensis]RDH43867.1 MFS transporter [Zooshikella ganghwensis]